MRALDLSGQTFCRLTVEAIVPSVGGKRRYACRCECGNAVQVSVSNLRSGHSKSCGCLASEVNRSLATQRNTVHGHNRAGRGNQSSTWHSWRSMRDRCLKKSHKSYADYGGRGINICDRWDEFANFLADMGERPDGTTLDRVDVNAGYFPENCRWATRSEQQRNKRCSAHD